MMKEIRMDWETFEKELKLEKETGYRSALWDLTYYMEGDISLENFMFLAKAKGTYKKSLIQLVKSLGREDELIEEKEEKEND